MNTADFESLLEKSEGDLIDFKSEIYDFDGTENEKILKRAKFVKDILSFANTPRENSAYIVMGVKDVSGKKTLVGVSDRIDDAVLQDKLNGMVYPSPKFSSSYIEYENKSFCVIEIPVYKEAGPFIAIREAGNILLKSKIYFRRSSKNDMADYEEQKMIYKWFITSDANSALSLNEPEWSKFVDYVNNFEVGRSYILMVPSMLLDDSKISSIGLLDWLLVIDFDQKSQKEGVLFHCKENIEKHRGLHVITRGDNQVYAASNATYWYLVRGIDGRNDTLVENKWKDWWLKYSKDVESKVDALSKIARRPVTLIVLWYNETLDQYYDTLLSVIYSKFDNCGRCNSGI